MCTFGILYSIFVPYLAIMRIRCTAIWFCGGPKVVMASLPYNRVFMPTYESPRKRFVMIGSLVEPLDKCIYSVIVSHVDVWSTIR